MKKQKKNNRLKINQDVLKKTDIPGMIFQFIAVLAGIYTLITIFADGIELEYYKELIVLAVVASAVLYTVIFLFPEFIKYSIPVVLFITGCLLWKNRAYIIDGFYHIENTIIYLINNYFNTRFLRYITDYEKGISITAMLVSLVQLLTILISAVVYYGICKQVVYILSILLLGLIFAVGKNPPELEILLLVAFLLYIVVSSFVPVWESQEDLDSRDINLKHRIYSQRRRTHSGIYASVIFFMLAIIVFIFYPSSRHNELEEGRRETADNIRYKIENIDLRLVWDTLSDKFIDTFFSDDKRIINIVRDSGVVYNGGLSGGNLGKAGEVSFTNETALKLTLPKDTDVVYLKGYVGVEYIGDAWENIDDETDEAYQKLLKKYNDKYYAQNQLSSYYKQLIKFPIMSEDNDIYRQAINFNLNKVKEYKMVIDYINADDNYIYLPYTINEVKPNVISSVSDSYYKPSLTSRLYYYSYYDLSIDEMLQAAGYYRLRDSRVVLRSEEDILAFRDYTHYMEEYNEFVLDAYLSVPDELYELKSMAYMLKSQVIKSSTLSISDNPTYDYRLTMIGLVEELLKTYMYTLSPGEVPEGRDYVEYFLIDNKKGYCAHFATAATLLLRSMGVPARYVEGYIVTRADIAAGVNSGSEDLAEYTFITENGEATPSENISKDLVTVEIRDTNAHAWVEVYFDDYGWVPIEATKGYSTSGYNINEEIRSNILDIPEPTKLPTNTPTPPIREYNDQGLYEDNFEEDEENITNPYTPSDKNGEGSNTNKSTDEPRGISKLIDSYKNLNPMLQKLINIITVILIITATIIIRYTLIWMNIRSRINRGSRKRRVLWLYYEIERLYRWLYIKKMDDQSYMKFAKDVTKYGQAPRNFERIMEIVLRARFSNELVTEEEYKEVYECYSYFRNTIYNRVGDKKRRWIKYIAVI